jgi:hypothetical protein
MQQWDAEDELANAQPENSQEFADWQLLERDLEATRLELPVPKVS